MRICTGACSRPRPREWCWSMRIAADFPVVYVNPGFEALTGYSSADLLGRNLRVLQGDDRDRTRATVCARRSSAGESCRVLLRNYRKDGSLFWNEMTILPLQGCGGTGHALRGSSSRRRRAAAHRPEALARLVERRASTDRRRRARRSVDRPVHAAVPAGAAEARLGDRAAREAQHRRIRHRHRRAGSLQRDVRPCGRRLGDSPRGALRVGMPAPLERCHRAHRRRQS